MKPFKTYQYIPGTEMTDRDKKEVNSNFWNKGKWDNFILPLLPKDCSDLTFVDIGCNAGLFLKFAEDIGFKNVCGVESDEDAIKKALEYRNENNGEYLLSYGNALENINNAMMSDFVILANVHYYMDINDWLNYLDKLQFKTRHVIIVTDENRRNPLNKTSASVESIKDYFKEWNYLDSIHIEDEKDPHPRNLTSLLFESKMLHKINIDKLDNGNAQQRGFYEELDSGVDVLKTSYAKRMKTYRLVEKRQRWSEEKYLKYMHEREQLYKSIKETGLRRPIIVNSDNRIVDGNHACAIMKHLGYKSVIVRRVL